MPLYFLVVPIPATLSPRERWSRFVKPLHDALIKTRTGAIIDFDQMVKHVDGNPVVTADELEIELRTWSGGMRVLESVLDAEGLPCPAVEEGPAGAA